MANIKLKDLLAENMRRFGTKNLNEDHPGILPSAIKMGAAAGGILKGVKDYLQLFNGKTKQEEKEMIMVFNIQNMIRRDTDPAEILRYMKSQDPSIDDATGIEIMKTLGQQLGLYVDPENEDDATPLS